MERLGDRGEADLGLLHKLLGEQQFPFFVNMLCQVAKRLGAHMLEFAAPDIGEVVSNRKPFKSAAKSVGKQTLKKNG